MYVQRRVQFKSDRCQLLALMILIVSNVRLSNAIKTLLLQTQIANGKGQLSAFLRNMDEMSTKYWHVLQ